MLGADAFIQTILEQPDADGPRLVFADWLEERGDPHAELIRLQCELTKLAESHPRRTELRAREQELLSSNDGRWRNPIRSAGLSARFRRGFLEVTFTGVRTFLETADALFAHPWVLHAHLRDATADLEDISELAASPHLARLQRLDLSRSYVGNDGVSKLARSPFRCRPTSLLLNFTQLSSTGLSLLIEHMNLTRLSELGLQGNTIGAVGAKAIAQAPRLPKLRVLDLSYNHLGTVGGEYLAESLFLSQLRSLSVVGNSIGSRGKKKLRSRFGRHVILDGPQAPF
jgi:uncharacterized protein (TIGR02996 family)